MVKDSGRNVAVIGRIIREKSRGALQTPGGRRFFGVSYKTFYVTALRVAVCIDGYKIGYKKNGDSANA